MVAPPVEEAERRALRLVGLTFLGLAVYVVVESARKLWLALEPEASPLGLTLAVVSLVSMPFLAGVETGHHSAP